MEAFLLVIPLTIAVVTVFYGVIYSLVAAWFEHRYRLALLGKLEDNPELLGESISIDDVLPQTDSVIRSERQNYALTGGILVGVGIFAAVLGRTIRVGEIAVGIYLGGVMCLALGVVLALLGLAVWGLSRRRRASV